jgi:hypothetical protein
MVAGAQSSKRIPIRGIVFFFPLWCIVRMAKEDFVVLTFQSGKTCRLALFIEEGRNGRMKSKVLSKEDVKLLDSFLKEEVFHKFSTPGGRSDLTPILYPLLPPGELMVPYMAARQRLFMSQEFIGVIAFFEEDHCTAKRQPGTMFSPDEARGLVTVITTLPVHTIINTAYCTWGFVRCVMELKKNCDQGRVSWLDPVSCSNMR